MTERIIPHPELSHINGELVFGKRASSHFLALEQYVHHRLGFGEALGDLYNQEAHQWLTSLKDRQEVLGYTVTMDDPRVNYETRQGLVRGVINCDAEVVQSRSMSLKRPDFIVILEAREGYVVGGYEVKRGLNSVRGNDARKQLHTATVTNLVQSTPSIARKVQDVIGTGSYPFVRGQILLPDTPRNCAYLEELRIAQLRHFFPRNTSIFPYALHRLSKESSSYWRLGKNTALFPTRTNTDFYDEGIQVLSDAFDVDEQNLPTTVYVRQLKKVNEALARRAHLPKGSEIEIGVPYTISEVFRTVQKAVLQIQQNRGIDVLRFDEFIGYFHGTSFFEFLELLHKELISKASSYPY